MRSTTLRHPWVRRCFLAVEQLEERTPVSENIGAALSLAGVAALARTAWSAPGRNTQITPTANVRIVNAVQSAAVRSAGGGLIDAPRTGNREGAPAARALAISSFSETPLGDILAQDVFTPTAPRTGGMAAGESASHVATPSPDGTAAGLPLPANAAPVQEHPPMLAPQGQIPVTNLAALAGDFRFIAVASRTSPRSGPATPTAPGSSTPTPPPVAPLVSSGVLYVYDANKGVVLPSVVPINDFSTWAMDLRAQVSGTTVSSYSWDLSHAPDATSISGQTSYRLQFTWASFTGQPRTDTISLTTTNSDSSHNTITLTYQVTATNSAAWASTPPTSTSTWASVLTPDTLLSQASTAAGPYAALGLADGAVLTAHGLPAYNPGVAPLGLVYDSAAANVQPVFVVHYPLDPTQAVPSTVTAQLTFNGTAGSTIYYNTSSLNPGDLMQMALQASATSLATGRYPWSLSVTANYSSPVTTTYSGNVDIINDSSSPFGAGWVLNDVQRIWSVTGGVILEEPGGQSLWFANGGTSGTFVTPAGDFSTLTQNTSTLIYTRTMPDGTQINFNSSGRQTSIVDRIGNTTTFSYNGSNQLTTITDMNNLVTTLAYNGSGLVSTITDPANRTTTLSYTGTQLTSLTDADSGVWRYGYDSANRLTTLTDPRSANTSADTTTFSYNFAGRISSVTQPDATTESLTPVQLQGMATPGTGTSGNPAPGTLAVASSANFTDPRSNVWTSALDWAGFGAATNQADPLGDTVLTFRDGNALPWLPADGLGRRTREFFDSKGNPTNVVQPDGTSTQSVLNSFSEPTQVTYLAPATGAPGPSNSVVWNYTYDSHGNELTATDPLNNTYTFTYTSKGSVATMKDPALSVTTYSYDSRNRLTSVQDPLNNITTYGYDSPSDLTSVQNPLGFTSTFSFDAMGRQLGQTIPVTSTTSAVTTLSYDAAGNLKTLKDPDSNTTTFVYDGMNRETGSTDPLLYQTTYGYDAAGNLNSLTDRNNHQTTFSYDAADRRINETWVGASPAYTATYAYNAANQLTSESDPFSAYQFTYDSEGRLSTVSDSGTTGLPSVTLTYGYDAFDNLTSISDSQNGLVSYDHDNDFNLTSASLSVSDTQVGQVTFSYDSLNRATNITRSIPGSITAHSITTSLSYDKDSNVKSITHKDAKTSTTLATYTYTYDAANQVSGYTGPEGTLTYTYDRSGQLTAVGGARNESYSYDVNGNRTMTGYSTGTGNQLSSDGTYNYTYDNEGNVKTKTRISDGQVTTFTWDYRNRLTEVVVKTSGGTVLQDDKFTYDVEDRRIGKNTLSGGQMWTLYQGDNPYADFNSSGTLTYRYLYGSRLDTLLARFDGTNTVWYLTDEFGSVRQLVSTSGTTLDQLTYDSFGNTLTESSPANGDRFKFTGREYDSEIGQYYDRARSYSPTVGRFDSQDPTGFTAGDTNLYRYVGNSPTNGTDPLGLAPPAKPTTPTPPSGGSGSNPGSNPGNAPGGTPANPATPGNPLAPKYPSGADIKARIGKINNDIFSLNQGINAMQGDIAKLEQLEQESGGLLDFTGEKNAIMVVIVQSQGAIADKQNTIRGLQNGQQFSPPNYGGFPLPPGR
jgi:RHS repeat-associated protein